MPQGRRMFDLRCRTTRRPQVRAQKETPRAERFSARFAHPSPGRAWADLAPSSNRAGQTQDDQAFDSVTIGRMGWSRFRLSGFLSALTFGLSTVMLRSK